MPTFQITAPDGKRYRVTGDSAEGAMAALMEMQGNAQPEAKSKPSVLGAAALGAADTGSFGFGDELGAALGATSEYLAGKITGAPARSYDELLGEMRGQDKAAQEAHPYAYMGGQVAGAIPLAVATGGQGMLAGAAGGSAGGFAYGFGSGEGGVIPRMDNAWKTGLVGGLGGAASPLIGKALGAVARPITEAIKARTPSIAGAIPGAVRRVMTGLEDDGLLDPVALAARRAEVGPDARLYNAGENMRVRAETLAQRPGPQMRTINEAAKAQTSGSGDRVRAGVDAALGNQQNFVKAFDDTMAARKAKANTLYGSAFKDKRPVNVNEVVAAIDAKIKPGVGDLQNDGTTATLEKVRNYFATDAGQRTDLESLHAVKMELDGIIGEAKRAGNNYKTSELLDVQRKLLEAMDGANPVYKTARNEFAGDIAIENAMQDGQTAFNRTLRPDQLWKEMAGMTAAEREAFKKGARDNVAYIMDNALPNLADNADAQAAWKRLMTEENKRKMEILIGDGPAKSLQGTLRREWQLSADANTILQNSATGRRRAAEALFPDPNHPATVHLAPSLYGRVEGLVTAGASKIATGALGNRSKTLNADAARLLALPLSDPTVDALMQARMRMAIGKAAGDKVAGQIGSVADVLRLPSGTAAAAWYNR